MKKFISFVMAAAMVASLVPATAFAKGEVTATAKVVDAKDLKQDDKGVIFNGQEGPEAQLKVTSVDYQTSYDKLPEMDITVTLDNAKFTDAALDNPKSLVTVKNKDGDNLVSTNDETVPGGVVKDKIKYTARGTDYDVALAAGATGFAAIPATEDNDTTAGYKAFSEFVAIPDIEAMTPEQHIAYWKGQGYVKKLVSGTPTYVKESATGEILDTKTEAFVEAAVSPVPGKTQKQLIEAAFAGVAAGTKEYVTRVLTPGFSGNEVVDVVGNPTATVIVTGAEVDNDEIKFTVKGFFKVGDVFAVDLKSTMKSYSLGKKATVSIDSKMATADDLVYATVVDKGIKASVKKTIDIAQEEVAFIDSKGLVVEPTISGSYNDKSVFELKLSSGFEFTKKEPSIAIDGVNGTTALSSWDPDGNTATFKPGTGEKFTITNIEIESVSAKTGAVATMKVTAKQPKEGSSTTYTTIGTASVEVAKVVDYKVILSVDEDEDVPVIYSGVNSENYGITDDSDHMSLEVKAEETFPGAWSMRSGFNFTLPEGVYVTDVDVVGTENFRQTKNSEAGSVAVGIEDWEKAFFNAYQKGEHKNFEFVKRVFDDVNTQLEPKKASVTFKLELVADPTFEGDVKLAFNGDLVDAQEVVIAKFVKPYTAKAEQNDVIIDYRNTEIKTPITVTEAAPGLWSENVGFSLVVDRGDMIQFEDDAAFTVDEKSGMEVKDTTTSTSKDKEKGQLSYTVKEESDGSAATVTIDKIELFMQRNIPAGAYKLEVDSTMNKAYRQELIFAADHQTEYNAELKDHAHDADKNIDKDCFIDDVADYSKVVKESFVNVITSGRDQDDASFTTKIVVPVGESYLIAGESKVELEVPAYINAAGYTMLPVRAISTSLGINNNNVLWNAETKTITILYGQRIITMTVGQKTIHVNGSAIPASSAPEITKERAFLPMRDLSTALGVTDITWDQATKTATMNGNQK